MKGGLQIQKKAWMGKLMVAIGVRVNENSKIVEWTHSHDTASFFLHWNDDFEYICCRTRYTSLKRLVESKYDKLS